MDPNATTTDTTTDTTTVAPTTTDTTTVEQTTTDTTTEVPTTTDTTTVAPTTTDTTTEVPSTTDTTTDTTTVAPVVSSDTDGDAAEDAKAKVGREAALNIDVDEPANDLTTNDTAQTEQERFAGARADALTNHAAEHDTGVGEEATEEEIA